MRWRVAVSASLTKAREVRLEVLVEVVAGFRLREAREKGKVLAFCVLRAIAERLVDRGG